MMESNTNARLNVSMETLGKRIEVMRKKTELSLLQNELHNLESELRAMEVAEEQADTGEQSSEVRRDAERPRRHLPDIPRGRREHVSFREPPNLYTYDESSILGAECGTIGRERQPLTSTPAALAPSQPDQAQEPSSKLGGKSGVKLKPATFDGSVSWTDYRAHFDACAEINGWTDREKGLYLAVSLRGQAQGVFGNLLSRTHDYSELAKALQERFAPPNQTELYRVQLRERRQKATESLSELGQDIRRLTNLAYPTAPSDLRETLSKEQFIDALVSSDMRIRVKQARPVDLNDAIRHAVELEAYNRAEKKHLEGQGFLRATSEKGDDSKSKDTAQVNFEEKLSHLQKSLAELQTSMQTLRQPDRQPQPPGRNTGYRRRYPGQQDRNYVPRERRKCYICGSEDHLKWACPLNEQKPQDEKPKEENEKHQSKFVASKSSGLYLDCKVNSVPSEFLVDTGATLSILSIKAWDVLSQNSSMMLQPFQSEVYTASGNPIDVKGKVQVMVDVNGIQCLTEMVVADIDVDGILGLDFLKKNNCTLDMNRDILTVKGRICKLSVDGKIGCYRISVSETVRIPSMSEAIIEGKVNVSPFQLSKLGIIEPNEKSFMAGKGMVAKALVEARDKVPVRIVNFGQEDATLFPGTHIANLSFVSNVHNIVDKTGKSSPTASLPEHLQDLYTRTADGLTVKQQKQVAKLLIKHESTFSKTDEDLGRTGIIRHKINTEENCPIKQPLRRLPVHMNAEADKQIDEMLKKDVIQPSSSPWASGIVMVTKKDGSKRFCVDYRKLNDITVKDAYPLPRIDAALDQLSGAGWFSCLDLNSGYWQVEVDEADRAKTAFVSRRGLFEFKTMPFGLCNAPATFERLMETVLAGLNWQICLIYLDDIIVVGKTFDDMIRNLDEVLQKLHEAGLKLKPRKCQLFAKRVDFLGHVISGEGIQTDPKKTQAVREWPRPESLHEVRSFLGFCSYYRRFIPKFAEISKPLHKLTEKNQKFLWTKECNAAFETLKEKMVSSPILAHPDFTKPFILDTDASDQAIGAVLSQKIEGKEHVIAYASRTLTKSERRYCVTRKELLAVINFVKYFRHYLYGRAFTVRTDHGSLRWLMKFKNPEGQIARWLETLSSYEFKIEHRPGRVHRNADGLSRIPCRQCGMAFAGTDISGTVIHRVSAQNNDGDQVDIHKLQEESDDIKRLKSWILEGKRPKHTEISEASYFLKCLWLEWPRLEVRDDLVVRRFEVLGTDIVWWQAILPLSERRTVLRYAHDIKSSGHLGVRKTLNKLRQRYFWPGMRNDVSIYVAGCDKCRRRKGQIPSKHAPMQVLRSGFPMERIAVDIAGPFPVSNKGNKYILVVQDYFTKWVECFSMANMEAGTVAKIVVEEVVTKFGIPNKIHSDQGRQFESELFKEMCKLLQIEKTRTTAYHPQSDGMVERFNRTLASMISMFVDENHSDWDELLPYMTMAYRATENETTGMSPNILMLGRETTTPLDIAFEMPAAIKAIPANQWVWELQDRMERAHTFVREQTGKSISRQKKYHDRKLVFDNIQAGDSVYVLFPVRLVGCSRKWTSFWRGPYKVSKTLSDVLYEVNCGRNGALEPIHIERLMKAADQTLPGEDSGEVLADSDIENIEEEESESEDQEDRADQGGRPRRVVRKPAWLTDYVCSLSRSRMGDREPRPRTKMTPRKHKQPGFICNLCKVHIGTIEAYKKHLMQCLEARVYCETCGKTFAKQRFFNQHMSRFHSRKAEKSELKASSTSQMSCDTEEIHIDKKEDNIGLEKVPSMELELAVRGGEMVQTVTVSKAGEQLFTSTSRNTGPRFGDLKCTFEDLFGPAKINLQDICVETGKGYLKIIKKNEND